MSWKSFLPSVFGSDEEKTNTAPASDRSGSGREADNSHAMAELEEAPAEEGGGENGLLITTEEHAGAGFDSGEVAKLIEDYLT